MDVDQTVLAIIREMARIPAALKAWRNPVTDLLNDNRLFNCNADAAEHWKPIVKTLFDADKTAFPELLCTFCRSLQHLGILTVSVFSEGRNCPVC
jgi:hypothetical protein